MSRKRPTKIVPHMMDAEDLVVDQALDIEDAPADQDEPGGSSSSVPAPAIPALIAAMEAAKTRTQVAEERTRLPAC